MHALFLTSNTDGKVLETKVGHVLQNKRQFFCSGWERGVMGTDEICLLKNGLNQQFSTGGDGAPPPHPPHPHLRGDLIISSGDIFVTTRVGKVLLASSGWGPRMSLTY